MALIDTVALAVYGFFIILFGAFSWYFVRRILEMRFKGDRSMLAVNIYAIYSGVIFLLTLIALIINNL